MAPGRRPDLEFKSSSVRESHRQLTTIRSPSSPPEISFTVTFTTARLVKIYFVPIIAFALGPFAMHCPTHWADPFHPLKAPAQCLSNGEVVSEPVAEAAWRLACTSALNDREEPLNPWARGPTPL